LDIARLLKKRQLNVQEQNALTAHSLKTCALYWRQRGLPPALREAGATRGIDWARSILLSLELDFPGMPSLYGELIDQGGRFIEFELESDPQHGQCLSVEQWHDSTQQQDFARHAKGIGMGRGAIAREVWRTLVPSPLHNRYKAAFVLALGSTKSLGDSGWEFAPPKPIDPRVAQHLVQRLRLQAKESYLGIDAFEGEDMQASVIHDEAFGIAEIAFKTYSEAALTALTHAWQSEPTGSTELFVPSREAEAD